MAAVEEEAVVVVAIARADATAGNFFRPLSHRVGEQQVGLLPYFFSATHHSRPPYQLSFQVDGCADGVAHGRLFVLDSILPQGIFITAVCYSQGDVTTGKPKST